MMNIHCPLCTQLSAPCSLRPALCALLLFCSLFFACGSEKNNPAIVEFCCLDQTLAPIKDVKVLFNAQTEKSDRLGRCRFEVQPATAGLRLPVNATLEAYKFAGPDSIRVPSEPSIKYILHLLRPILISSKFNLPATMQMEFKTELEVVKIDSPHQQSDIIVPPKETYLIQVTSEPTGSKVTITRGNKIIVGEKVTPFRLPVENGIYKFEAKNGSPLGYKAIKPLTRKISSNQPIHLIHEIMPLQITVTSEPKGANLYLDKIYQGQTTLTLSLEKINTYILKIEMYGFETIEEIIDYSAMFFNSQKVKVGNDEIPIPFSKKIPIFRPLKGILVVAVTFELNQDAKIEIDGKPINSNWQKEITTSVTAGYHTITIQYKKPNRVRTIKKHLVEPGNNIRYHLDQLYPDSN